MLLAAGAAVQVRAATLPGTEPELTARIIGGRLAGNAELPAMVALLASRQDIATKDRFFCGGTLIAPTWVLTAAHCLFDFSDRPIAPESFRVLVGVTDLDAAGSVDEYTVARIVSHPDFDVGDPASANDLGLIELDAGASPDRLTLLAPGGDSLEGVGARAFGWGATEVRGGVPGEYSAHLQAASVPIVSLAQCNASRSYDGIIGADQLCAGRYEGGVDTCAGDSGGPLVVESAGVQVQAGIVSFGAGCAEPGLYGVYTRLASFTDWIAEHVEPDLRRYEAPSSMTTGEGGAGAGGGVCAILLSLIATRRRRPASHLPPEPAR